MEAELSLYEKLDTIESAFYVEATYYTLAHGLKDHQEAQWRVDALLDAWLDLGGLAVEASRG